MRRSRREFLVASAAMLGELAGRQSALGGVLTGRQIARDDEQPGTWHPGLFPEMIARAWYQEDLSEGPVAEWRSRGVKPVTAKQKSPSLRPIKLPGRDGVKFAKGHQTKFGMGR